MLFVVMVDVATICPEAFVERIELIAVDPTVSDPLNVFVPENVLFVYVFGIVVEELMYEFTLASV